VALKKKKMQEIEAAQEEIELEADRRLSERPRHKPRSPIGEVIIPEADDWMEQMEMGKTPDVSTFIPQRRTPTKPAARTVVTSPGHTSLTQDRALKLEERTKNLKNFEKLAEDDDDDSIDYITRKSSKITSFFSKVSKAKPSSTSASTTTSAKPKPSLPTSAIYDDDNDDLVFVGEVHSPTKQPPSRTSKTEVDFYRKLITTESRPKAAAIYGDSDDDSQDHTVPEPDPRDIIKKRKQRESPPSDVEEGGELSDLEEPAKKYKKASEKRSKPALKKRRSSDYDELSDVDDFIVADDASVEEYDDELPDEVRCLAFPKLELLPRYLTGGFVLCLDSMGVTLMRMASDLIQHSRKSLKRMSSSTFSDLPRTPSRAHLVYMYNTLLLDISTQSKRRISPGAMTLTSPAR
jgi:hypothetical protein